jgi:betaine-aldehyde dehydrogenase
MSASSVVTFDEFFIGGSWVAPSATERIEVISPHSEEVAGSVPAGAPEDITLSSRVETGTIAINGFGCQMVSPFGGVKSSGLGREMGPEGLKAYIELQSVLLPPAQ